MRRFFLQKRNRGHRRDRQKTVFFQNFSKTSVHTLGKAKTYGVFPNQFSPFTA
jgi:hypothetical protein